MKISRLFPLFLLLAVVVLHTAPNTAGAQVRLVAGANKTVTALNTNVFVVHSRQGKFYSVSGFNGTGAAIWIQMFDTNAVPAEGTPPSAYHPVLVPAASNFSIDEAAGYNFRSGLIVVASTTPVSKTNAAATVHFKATYYDRAY